MAAPSLVAAKAGFGTYSTREVCQNVDTSPLDASVAADPIFSPLVRAGVFVECEQLLTDADSA
ncbi:MAG: hypothetical protein ABWY04_10160, partial [Arthrobacter sp.]